MSDPFLRPPRKPPPAPGRKAPKRDFSRCPRCGAPTEQSTSISGLPSEFWRNCTKCNVWIDTYVPQPHQREVHLDPHRIVGNFGGYGSGKTLTSRKEVQKHLLITQNANVLIGANVTSQYEQTLKRELEADLPRAFMREYSVQKQHFDLVNGARVIYRPLDEPDKLRSYNLTMFVMLEASEVRAESFFQLKTRLRNTSASLQTCQDGEPVLIPAENDPSVLVPLLQADWRKGIVESNPDSGWIRTDVLLNSALIRQHGTVSEQYAVSPERKDPNISSHISSTDANKYLPPNYFNEQARNKPRWWVARFLFGSFTYAEGLVYPAAAQHIVESFDIPKEWKRLVAFDYGLHDDAVFLFVAVDPKTGNVYVYDEARTQDMNIDQLSQIYFDRIRDIPSGGMYCAPLIDPKSGVRRDYNKDSLRDLFLQKGIWFDLGYVSLDARIFRLNTYFESGRLKIMDRCQGLIDELREYKFPNRTLDSTKRSDKPVDKNNHAINPLEWIVMRLPDDPRQVQAKVYDPYGMDTAAKPAGKTNWLPHALQDDASDPERPPAYGLSRSAYCH